jgi:kynurenine formamidase
MTRRRSLQANLFMVLAIFASVCLFVNTAFAERIGLKIQATKVIDMTHPMYEGMPFWPGGDPFKMERRADYDKGYQLHKFDMGENTGTHVDAPSHFIKGNQTIDKIPLNRLIARVVMINVQEKVKFDPDYELSAGDIRKWEIRYGKIKKGSLVIMNTGWHKKFSNPSDYINMDKNKVMHFPGYSPSAAKLLVNRDVAGIGIDTLSLDNGPSKDFKTHVIMLKANKYQIENMNNLDAIPPAGAVAIIGVLPVKGGSQAQARIFALLP